MCGVLCGCASMPNQTYPNTLDKNLAIHLNLGDVNSLPSKMDVYAGIYDITKDCTDHFQGEIALSPGLNQIGLAPGKRVYIVVAAIDGGNFLSRSRSFTKRQGALLDPRPGRRYEIIINYIDEMWDFRLYDVNTTRRQSLPVVSISACKPS